MSNPTIVSSEEKNRQLIVLFSFDALRADHLGLYGYPRNTSPNIDAFAREAVIFENAYTAETWTLSSFASLFTSLYPSFHNVREINQFLNPSLENLPDLLHKNGYYTGAFIDNPFLHPLYGFSKGFDSHNFHITNVEDRVRSANEWLKSSKSDKQFLFLHIISPHTPYTAPNKYAQQISPDAKWPIDSGAYKRLINREGCADVDPADLNEVKLQYDAEIRQADDLFQTLIDTIREAGLYDDATIIVMSDHGEEFDDHGRLWHGENVFPATARVPLIVKFPSTLQKHGIRISDRVHLIDVAPTLLELANINRPGEMQGVSLISSMRGTDSNRTLFTENRKGVLGIIRDRYHYVFTDPDAGTPVCPPGKSEELYDLIADPEERNDLSSKRPDLMIFFKSEMKYYFERAAQFRKSKFSKESKQVEPNSELNEQIRALGYIH